MDARSPTAMPPTPLHPSRSQTPAPLSPSWQSSKGLHSFSLAAGVVGGKTPSEERLRGGLGRQAAGERDPPQSQPRNERRDLFILGQELKRRQRRNEEIKSEAARRERVCAAASATKCRSAQDREPPEGEKKKIGKVKELNVSLRR